jgi:hypothetical protein
MTFILLYNFCPKRVSLNKYLASYIPDVTETHVSVHVNRPLLLSDSDQIRIDQQFLAKLSSINSHKNLFSGFGVLSFIRTGATPIGDLHRCERAYKE